MFEQVPASSRHVIQLRSYVYQSVSHSCCRSRIDCHRKLRGDRVLSREECADWFVVWLVEFRQWLDEGGFTPRGGGAVTGRFK